MAEEEDTTLRSDVAPRTVRKKKEENDEESGMGEAEGGVGHIYKEHIAMPASSSVLRRD